MHSVTLMIMVKNFVLLLKNFVAGILSHKADLNVDSGVARPFLMVGHSLFTEFYL